MVKEPPAPIHEEIAYQLIGTIFDPPLVLAGHPASVQMLFVRKKLQYDNVLLLTTDILTERSSFIPLQKSCTHTL